jgi:hypothetical protein
VEIRTELIYELLKDYQKPEDIIGENGLLNRFVKAVLELAMNAGLTHHPLATAPARSSRRSCRNIRRGSRALATRSFRCMRAA